MPIKQNIQLVLSLKSKLLRGAARSRSPLYKQKKGTRTSPVEKPIENHNLVKFLEKTAK